jgi:hypothetical protein
VKQSSSSREAPSREEMNAAMRELADLAVRYPFRWFTQGKVARIFGFGDDVMSALTKQGAPVIARRCNPHLLHKWLEENLDRVGKIRMGE